MSMIARPHDGTAFSEFSPIAHASLVAALFKKFVSILQCSLKSSLFSTLKREGFSDLNLFCF
jgi:hypothetical protein